MKIYITNYTIYDVNPKHNLCNELYNLKYNFSLKIQSEYIRTAKSKIIITTGQYYNWNFEKQGAAGRTYWGAGRNYPIKIYT